MHTVSILIVSYNTRELTLSALQSIYDETIAIDFEVIVVDNASNDGSADAIKDRFPGVKLIASHDNLGFAAANNLAAKYAAGEYVLLLNPDTIVLDSAICKLISFARRFPDGLIWGGKTLFKDGSLNPSSCWRDVSLWNIFCQSIGISSFWPNSEIFNSAAYGGWDRSTVRRVDIVSGCFLLIKRELWGTLGGFDSRFFMYGEEADLCVRARKLGAQPLVTPEAVIVHYGGASETVRSNKMVRMLSAKRLLMKTHWSPWACRVGKLLYYIYPLSRWICFSFLSLFNRSRQPIAKSWKEIWLRRIEWI